MLHPLPVKTFGEIAARGLKATVYCSACYEHRPIQPAAEHLRDRCFATTRFRCTKIRYTGNVCRVGRDRAIHAAANRRRKARWSSFPASTCLPSWEINYVPIDQPPWSAVNRDRGDRFKCPGCHKPVAWHIHGASWRPTYSHAVNGELGRPA